jgi:hypothetical protein
LIERRERVSIPYRVWYSLPPFYQGFRVSLSLLSIKFKILDLSLLSIKVLGYLSPSFLSRFPPFYQGLRISLSLLSIKVLTLIERRERVSIPYPWYSLPPFYQGFRVCLSLGKNHI